MEETPALEISSPEGLTALGYRVGVVPGQKTRGAVSLEQAAADNILLATVVDFQEAFLREWSDDAHLLTYFVTDPDGNCEEAWPRINKINSSVLQEIRLAGGDVKTSCFVFDWDTSRLFLDGQKREMTSELFDQFIAKFMALPALTLKWASKFTYFYTTKNGIRLVYALRHPLPCDRAEALHKLLVRGLREGGLLVDAISDWTRLFRLPRIVRDDDDGSQRFVWPHAGSFFVDEWQYHLFDPIPILGEQALLAPAPRQTRLALPQPSPDDVNMVLGTPKSRPSWWKAVEHALRSKLCYTTVFNNRELSPLGSRDITIQRFTGELCCALALALRKGDQVGPLQVYALLYQAVAQLAPDAQTPDWTVVLWRSCLKYWAAELDKIEQEKVTQQVQEVQALGLGDSVLAGMREWVQCPEIRLDDGQALLWASEHLLLHSPADRYYVMRRDGYYDPIAVKAPMVKARVRELGMEALIPLGYDGEKGWKNYTADEIITRHATSVLWVEGHAGGPGNYVKGLRGDNPTLCLRLYRRRSDLSPTYSPLADEWLRVLGHTAGGYELLKAWIGWALAFDQGPIAALALIGTRGVGKKMLLAGLAESISTESFADSNDLGNFGGMLLRSPFLSINEGVKRDQNGYDPADIFRLMTGGDPLQVNTKFRDPVIIKAPTRVVIMANNNDVLSLLAGKGRNLSQEDRQALMQRIVCVKVHDSAQAWNRMKGGKEYTKGWIADDGGGQTSDYVLARHFLHLYETRPAVPKGNRFLVEGSSEDPHMTSISTRTGQAPVVIETLVAAIERAAAGASVEGVVVQRTRDAEFFGPEVWQSRMADGVVGELPRVWVTVNAVRHWLSTNQNRTKEIPQHEIAKILRGIQRATEPEGGRMLTLKTVSGERKAAWWNVSLDSLLAEAYTLGYKCAHLEKLCEERRNVTKFPVRAAESRGAAL